MNEDTLNKMLAEWATRNALPKSRAMAIRAIPAKRSEELSPDWWKAHFRRVETILRQSTDVRRFLIVS